MKNCLIEYLTPECKNCPDWHNGSDGSIGCGTRLPIDWCKAFTKMINEQEKNGEVTRNFDEFNDVIEKGERK